MNKYFYYNNRLIHTRPTRLSAEPTIGIEPCWPLRSPGLLGTERDMPAKKNKKIIFEIEIKYSKAYIFLGVWSSFQGSQRSPILLSEYMFLLAGNIMLGAEKLWGELLFPEENRVFLTKGRKTVFPRESNVILIYKDVNLLPAPSCCCCCCCCWALVSPFAKAKN